MQPSREGITLTAELKQQLDQIARKASGDDGIEVVVGPRGAGHHYDSERNVVYLDPSKLSAAIKQEELCHAVKRIAADSCSMGERGFDELRPSPATSLLRKYAEEALSTEWGQLRQEAVRNMNQEWRDGAFGPRRSPFLPIDHENRVSLRESALDRKGWEIIGIRQDPERPGQVQFAVWKIGNDTEGSYPDVRWEQRHLIEPHTDLSWVNACIANAPAGSHPDLDFLREQMATPLIDRYRAEWEGKMSALDDFRNAYPGEDFDTLRKKYQPIVDKYASSATFWMRAVAPLVGEITSPYSPAQENHLLASMAGHFYWHMSEKAEVEAREVYTARAVEMATLAKAYGQFIKEKLSPGLE